MKTLVIGGTGPTGPYIVNGLLERGHNVTLMHSGIHEVEFARPIEHIHADVHFESTLSEALGKRTFDLVVATYGRLKVIADVMVGRIGRLVFATGTDIPSGADDEPLALTEQWTTREDPDPHSMRHRKFEAEQSVMEHHHARHYAVTLLKYVTIYGPRAPGTGDWSLVRRILDGRRRLIIADGGTQLENRLYPENGGHAVLLAVDKPEVSAGQVYNVADEDPITMLQRVNIVAAALGHTWQLVSMPWDLARPFHPVCWLPGHNITDVTKIKTELGYRDIHPTREAQALSAQWLAQNQPERGGELEIQLRDPFDYAAEDAMIDAFLRARQAVRAVPYPDWRYAHPYRHPKQPNEQWQTPDKLMKLG